MTPGSITTFWCACKPCVPAAPTVSAFENPAVRAGPVVQPHADELHVFTDRRIEPVATHMDFRVRGQLQIGKRGQRAIGLALVDIGKTVRGSGLEA